ncbi:FAD-dependent oxidoreductase [Rhodoferax sp. GW822-FHT02A01]|uniref:NAD(P)/FAD-dependent oxidoreductase n=1 Tax=Rhodoferax sp. GW822-FHT02A01 TaxID=3141537 RepID=UPI00315C8CC3
MNHSVTIIGAGVIGLAIALRLQDDGRQVLLIDPAEPGSGASFGNAGTIAGYGCVPVGTPDVLRALPRLLLDSDSPFSMPMEALPSLMPWLWRFVRASTPSAANASANTLATLLTQVGPSWDRRWRALRCEELIRREGCLYLYRQAPSPRAFDFRLRERLGIHQQLLSPNEVSTLEPAVAHHSRHGLFFPDAVHITSPAKLMQQMYRQVMRGGAYHLRAKVTGLKKEGNGAVLEIAYENRHDSIRSETVIIAAGAHSRELALQAGEQVPLDTERGYHVEYTLDKLPLRRPICPVERGFYITPMEGRLRVAGTVELGGLARPANPRQWALLDRGARVLFPDLPTVTSEWMGFRPSMPDSVPVIGRARGVPAAILAFGHGHLGLTLATVTADLVAAEVSGRANAPAACSPQRFSH